MTLEGYHVSKTLQLGKSLLLLKNVIFVLDVNLLPGPISLFALVVRKLGIERET